MADQQAELLGQVVAKQVRARDGGGPVPRHRHVAEGEPRVDVGEGGGGDRHLRIEGAQPARLCAARQQRIEADRKRVVEGKSVSVRVDLGGRRNSKNTNKEYTSVYTSCGESY